MSSRSGDRLLCHAVEHVRSRWHRGHTRPGSRPAAGDRGCRPRSWPRTGRRCTGRRSRPPAAGWSSGAGRCAGPMPIGGEEPASDRVVRRSAGHDRRRVPGARVGERAVRGVVDGHDHGGEVAVELAADGALGHLERQPRLEAGAEVGAQRVAHEGRVGESLAAVAGDVAEDERGATAGEGQGVVEVTAGAGTVRGAVGNRGAHRADGLGHRRQQRGLQEADLLEQLPTPASPAGGRGAPRSGSRRRGAATERRAARARPTGRRARLRRSRDGVRRLVLGRVGRLGAARGSPSSARRSPPPSSAGAPAPEYRRPPGACASSTPPPDTEAPPTTAASRAAGRRVGDRLGFDPAPPGPGRAGPLTRCCPAAARRRRDRPQLGTSPRADAGDGAGALGAGLSFSVDGAGSRFARSGGRLLGGATTPPRRSARCWPRGRRPRQERSPRDAVLDGIREVERLVDGPGVLYALLAPRVSDAPSRRAPPRSPSRRAPSSPPLDSVLAQRAPAPPSIEWPGQGRYAADREHVQGTPPNLAQPRAAVVHLGSLGNVPTSSNSMPSSSIGTNRLRRQKSGAAKRLLRGAGRARSSRRCAAGPRPAGRACRSARA